MQSVKIKSITPVGRMKTMDIEVDSESHIFFGNGIATSNSHAVAYSIISYRDAWLKHNYPHEFYAGCLSVLDLEKQNQIIKAIVEEDIIVRFPKLGKSKATQWTVYGDVVYMPFAAIVGCGDKIAHNIVAPQEVGLFASIPVIKAPANVKKVLDLIHVSDPEWEPEFEDLSKVRKSFQIDIMSLFDR